LLQKDVNPWSVRNCSIQQGKTVAQWNKFNPTLI
jgi:hypothetical protein